MAAAGLDAFIGNASEQLAMANLASLPTVAVPVGLQPLPSAPGSARRHVRFPLACKPYPVKGSSRADPAKAGVLGGFRLQLALPAYRCGCALLQ